MRKWKPGAKVQHNTGGPAMAVMAVAEDGMATCNWFDNAGKPNTKDFHSDELVKHPAPVTRIELVAGKGSDEA